MTGALLLAGLLPWIALGAALAFGIREPRPLPDPHPAPPDTPGAPDTPDAAPLVSIIVPARNEETTITRCLASLTTFEGAPPFELLIVDDRSTDRTAEIARAHPRGSATRISVVEGEPLPDGWFGKPWACFQGARSARGEILLFVDADTRHHPELLARTLAALDEDRADVLSLLGEQEMGTPGERLVQPHVFLLIGMRYRQLDRVLEGDAWTEAIANGQFVLVRRNAYEAIGGHGAVRGEVVEDLRLAQELVRAGFRLTLREARAFFSTRMYTSLPDLVNGWTKNVAIGARQASTRLGPIVLPGILAFLLLAWVLPPVVLLALTVPPALSGALPDPSPLLAWSALVTGMSALIWAGVHLRFGGRAAYALLYPAGASVVAFIVARSWLRGTRRIEWKGRTYTGGREAVP